MKVYFIFIASLFLLFGCTEENDDNNIDIDFRKEMRDFVKNISTYAKNTQSNFIIIPQNGQELITNTGDANGNPYIDYLNAIDATGREDFFYGYYNDDEATPVDEKQFLLDLCLICENHGVEILTTDYCSTPTHMDDSYFQNGLYGFISFAADQRALNNIPSYPTQPHQENENDIQFISQAQNFLYLINSENFTTKQDFINAVSNTNYDVIIMDLFHNELSFNLLEINELKTKANGGSRLVICYMSIGEAEYYRYYWQSQWLIENPSWLEAENPYWEGNYKVRYWETEWQHIIFGNTNSYLDKILAAGYDGVYLDIIDAYEYFE
jgi:cysteinyl-tRNA synthetase